MELPAVPTVSVEDIRCAVPDPSPEFRSWVWDWYRRGTLDVVVAGAIRQGLAADVREALTFMHQAVADQHPSQLRIAVADLNGRRLPSRAFRQIQELVTGNGPGAQDPTLKFGKVSHNAIAHLLTSPLPEPARPEHVSVLNGELFPLPETPIEYVEPPQMALPPTHALTRRRKTVLAGRIIRDWNAARATLPEATIPWWAATASHRSLRNLDRSLQELFGDFATQLKTLQDPPGWLLTISLMSLASAVATCGKTPPRTLFREVPVLGPRHRVSGGSVDALEVVTIGGRPPTTHQRAMLAKLAAGPKRSVSNLLALLYDYFRRPLGIRILDWKFVVGDVPHTGYAPTIDELIARPLEHHRAQMERYVLLSVMGFAAERGIVDLLMDAGRLTVTGEIWYLLPQRTPVVHPIVLSPEERARIYQDSIVTTWPRAQRLASNRAVTRLIMSRILGTVRTNNGNGNGHRNGVVAHPTLFPTEEMDATLRAHVVRQRVREREFADQHRMLEVVGRRSDGAAKLEMHYDAVLAAIEKGSVRTGFGFSPERGGKIACPIHGQGNERTPSMNIYMGDVPRFYCFGCETRGHIADESIPKDLVFAAPLSPFRTSTPRMARHRYAIEPARHAEVMHWTQEYLAAAFPGSQAERYVTRERHIDRDLAVEFGVGFGSDTVVNDLLDRGLGLDELLFFGILRLSEGIGPNSPTVRLLRRRGLATDDIERQVRSRTGGNAVTGRPYFALGGRLTFPLELDGRPNNVYGRHLQANCDAFLRHRKLSIEHTRVPQGGFHMSVLRDPRCSEAIVTEGVLDALTLIMWGYRNTLSLIGVANVAITQELARFPGRIGVALDNDRTGFEKTVKLTAALTELGHRGGIFNFTEFFNGHTPFEGADDFNRLLIMRARTQPTSPSAGHDQPVPEPEEDDPPF